MNIDTVRSWKDEAYRLTLSEEQLSVNPAGELELTDADLESIYGGCGFGREGFGREGFGREGFGREGFDGEECGFGRRRFGNRNAAFTLTNIKDTEFDSVFGDNIFICGNQFECF